MLLGLLAGVPLAPAKGPAICAGRLWVCTRMPRERKAWPTGGFT